MTGAAHSQNDCKMDLLRTNGAPVKIHRDSYFALYSRYGIVVEEPTGKFYVITSRLGWNVRKIPIDDFVKYRGWDPKVLQRVDFGSDKVYEDYEIAERARLALKQDHNGIYFVGNTDQDFVYKMAVRLDRDEWRSPYAETTTDNVFIKSASLQPEKRAQHWRCRLCH